MRNLGLIVPYDYKLLSTAAILEVLDTANRICRENKLNIPFSVQAVAVPGEEGNINFPKDVPILTTTEPFHPDLILIPAFTTVNMAATIEKNQLYIPWLQQQYKNGAEIASFCTGAFLFAATGLLNGKVATTHADASHHFARLFPEVRLKPDLAVTADGRTYTSGGATSTFHLLLFLIKKFCGNSIAVRIAKIFAIDMDRYKQSHFGSFVPIHDHNDTLVKRIQHHIETNFHEIETIEEIMKDIPSSRRNIVRRFKQATGVPPILYLQNIRIESAKKQLEQTSLNINEIIWGTGYSDPKSFRKTFNKIVGMTPLEYREKFMSV